MAGHEALEPEDWDPEDRGEAQAVPRWWGWLALGLSLVGLGISVYLTIDHFTGALPVCSATGIVDCAKVTTSAQSEIFGVLPVALLGLIFFAAMTVVNLPVLWRAGTRVEVAWARAALAVIGIGTVLYLLVAELFEIHAICLWCTGIHVITFFLFVLILSTAPVMTARSWGTES